MVAVLASPRFLFREEGIEPTAASGRGHPLVDEHALASRLSYFFWSTMPDEELFRLARENGLRASLSGQITRLLTHPRSGEFVRNFTGQWLQARDITTVVLDDNAIYEREHPRPKESLEARATFTRLRDIPEAQRTPEQAAQFAEALKAFRERRARTVVPTLSRSLREAMQQETEMLFEHLLKEDRPLTELIDSPYTFLNEELAKHYGIEGVTGRGMRKVTLPPDSPRGGVLTMGTVLATTSNPTRTSPVKRGKWILEQILGSPPPPAPPSVPTLEGQQLKGNLRQRMEQHRADPACASCHSRMDAIGFAFEKFDAVGQIRQKDEGQPIDPSGKLPDGRSFAGAGELKKLLLADKEKVVRNLSSKLLTFGLGRGLDYYDGPAVDKITEAALKADGRFSALVLGVVQSEPFRLRRGTSQVEGGSQPAKK